MLIQLTISIDMYIHIYIYIYKLRTHTHLLPDAGVAWCSSFELEGLLGIIRGITPGRRGATALPKKSYKTAFRQEEMN